jgi:hypothetical protein
MLTYETTSNVWQITEPYKPRLLIRGNNVTWWLHPRGRDCFFRTYAQTNPPCISSLRLAVPCAEVDDSSPALSIALMIGPHMAT